MSVNGQDEEGLGSIAGSQHEDQEDFGDMIGTQVQESYQLQEEMDLRYDPNAPPADPTPEPGATLESNETVMGGSELVVLDSGVLPKHKDSASPTKDGQLQALQPKTPRGSASPPSVIPETQTSEGPVPTQRSDINGTRTKRTPKAIPADACIIDLDSLEIASPEVQSHESSPGIKNEDDCIEIAQKEFSPRIKQEFNDNDRWVWCTSKDDPMVIEDDDEESFVQVRSRPDSGSPASLVRSKLDTADAENLDAERTHSSSNRAEDIAQEVGVETTDVDVPMHDNEVSHAITNTEAATADQTKAPLNLGKSILGRPTKPLTSKEDRKKMMIEASKLWAAQGIKKAANVGGASTVFHKPVLTPGGGQNAVAGSSKDAPPRHANEALLDSDEWMNMTLDDNNEESATKYVFSLHPTYYARADTEIVLPQPRGSIRPRGGCTRTPLRTTSSLSEHRLQKIIESSGFKMSSNKGNRPEQGQCS